MKPTQGRRTWIKLYAEDWLDGTTRYQMNGAQRAFWVDLMAMAGRGRVGGIVCAGLDPGNKLIGYPIEKFQALSPAEPLDVLKTLSLFERTGKIKIESEKNEFGLTLYVIRILNWTHYQSEYERVKPYRQNATEKVQPKSQVKSQVKSQKRHKTEVELEVDSDSESDLDDDDASRKKRAAASKQVSKSKPKPPLDPVFQSFCESQILRTAKECGEEIRSERAYLKKALPAFLDNQRNEVVTFLAEQVGRFVTAQCKGKPHGFVVPFETQKELILDLRREFHLPYYTDLINEVLKAAIQRFGLSVFHPKATDIPQAKPSDYEVKKPN
ncbi:MAG TPA: hypothetical protein VOA88_10310 [Candidatus Dormibacteraeota bacterium]|nr:hypothetical protein [Candidatus Dormibacteraeota bacterium]